MTCREITTLMLDAELDELTGIGPSRVARHVRECIPCRMVARRIIGATSRLAVDLGATDARVSPVRAAPPPARRGVLAAVGIAAAALILVVGLDGDRSTATVSLPPAVVASAARTPLPTPDTPSTRIAARLPQAARQRGRAAPARSVPVPRVIPSATTPMARAVASVGVEVPLGKEAVVMRTADPQVTVVWLR